MCIRHSCLPEELKYDSTIIARTADLTNYRRLNEIKTNIVEFVEGGNSLVIYSIFCGNGKTVWASKLLIEYVCCIGDGNYMDTRVLFINVVDLLMQVRMNREYDTDRAEVKNIITQINKADLVVWDEIGVKQLTEYEVMFLYSLINKRINNKQANIYTSNTTLRVAQANLSDRLYSRIYNLSEKIEFVSDDYRGKKVN